MSRRLLRSGTRGEAGGENRRSDLISHIVEDAPDAIWVLDASLGKPERYRIAYANAAFEQIYELPRSEALQRDASAFFAERAAGEDLERILSGFAAGTPFTTTRLHRRNDGRDVWLQVNYQPVEADGVLRWTIVSRDVTEAAAAHQHAEHLARALDELREAIAVETARDEHWYIEYVNGAFCALLGYNAHELLGKSWRSLLATGADRKRAEDCRVGLLSGQKVDAELLFRRKGNGDLLLNFSATPLDNGAGEYTSAVTIFRDVTQRRREERRLSEQARLDPLTGLANRREFEHLLRGAIEMTVDPSPAHVLLFIDLDRFKEVNDRFGHDAGDRVLIAIARLLRAQVLETDRVARWGGDEFAAILYFCDLRNGVKAGERIVRALAESAESHGVGASIGVVPIQHGMNAEELMRRADSLVYQAKATGRGRVVTTP
jgi:diguanylate cyclase (GGDEF)-like protein/PAS domain S-box-containing protein